MTTLLFVLGIALVGLSARLLAHAFLVPRLHLKAHLLELEEYGFTQAINEAHQSAGERLKARLRSTAQQLGGWLMSRVPSLPVLSKSELAAAGLYDVSEELMHGSRAMLALGLPGLILLMMLAGGGKLSPLQLLMIMLLLLGGWQLPSMILRRRGATRLDDIDRQLPELIDLLIATIEAGMGFAAATKLVAERMAAPLGDELRLTLRQQSLGMSMGEALMGMGDRCATASVRAFVRTAARGESMGMSIGPVLRELSSDQRRRRRQAAREKMQKAPIKMLFPVMFLIMPALMIVLMYPAAYSLIKNLSAL
ncbi:MAG TPA: type II secretion system F family protein [Solirubrobacteraceae bacterium]|nr:type II secretion system F family protein [Solirubrobacteraceae bacterium]